MLQLRTISHLMDQGHKKHLSNTQIMENEMLNEIFNIEQWNISWWAMKYSMKFTGILNETGPTLNENAFHSFMVAKQIFLLQLPQLHRCNWQLPVVHRMVSSRCQWCGTRVVSDYGNGGSREEQLQYFTWVDAGDGARRSRVIMVGARHHPWVVDSSHKHSFLSLIDNVDCLVYSRILCKAIIIANLCMLQVVGTCGHCDGNGGRSPPLVEGGWWIVVVIPCCVVLVSPSMWHNQMDYWYEWVDCWMEERIERMLQAQQRINNAWKMPTADRELCKLLLCSLLGSKKYGKMYLESLRNGINI